MNSPTADLPVLPGQIVFEKGEHRYGAGMTIRQFYAGLVMPSVVAQTPDYEGDIESVFRLTLKLTDGLLAALEEPRSE